MAEVPSHWKMVAGDLKPRTFTLEYTEDDPWTLAHLVNVKSIDALYAFEAAAKCPVALYLDDTLMYEDCSDLSFEDALPISLMYEEHRISDKHGRGRDQGGCIRLVPSIGGKVTCQAAVLPVHTQLRLLSKVEHKVPKGTILKRLQNPETQVGNYFSFHDADLGKCGVSRFYTDKNGCEQEKETHWFRVKHSFMCLTNRALDTTDTWSSSTPYKCEGGEIVLRLFTTTTDTWDDYFIPITEDEAKRGPGLVGHKTWRIDDLEDGIVFDDGLALAFVPHDHPIMAIFNEERIRTGKATYDTTHFMSGSPTKPFFTACDESVTEALESVRRKAQTAEATHAALSSNDLDIVFPANAEDTRAFLLADGDAVRFNAQAST